MSEIRPTLDLDLVWTAGHLPRRPIDADLFRLLEAIKRSGKLSVATAEVGLHYRQGWGLITAWSERMEEQIESSPADPDPWRCIAITTKGSQCKLPAAHGDTKCAIHGGRAHL